MRKGTATAVLGILMLVASSSVLASGLAIPEQGAAAMGMSAAVTAHSENLSAIYYNPAGLDYVAGFEVMLGATPISPYHKYSPFQKNWDIWNKTTAESAVFLPPYLYAALRMNDSIVLGLGVNSPFGLGTDWDKSWAGRYTSTFAEIQSVAVTPTITYEATDKVSVGAGLVYTFSNAKIEKMTDTGSQVFKALGANPALASMIANPALDSEFKLDGDGTGLGWKAGMIYRHDEDLTVGASFTSAMDIDYDGTAKFIHNEQAIKGSVMQALQTSGMSAAQISATADAVYAGIASNLPASQDGTATLHLPWSLNMGVKYNFNPDWDGSLDLNIVGWSVYEDLIIDFATDKPADKIVQPKDWVNSYVVRAGTQRRLSENLVGRAGMMWDFNPVPDETFDGQLPDSDRFGISFGAGYTMGRVRIDASYLFLKFFKRTKDNGVGYSVDTTENGVIDRFDVPEGYPVGNGKYVSRANLASLSLSLMF